MKLKPSVIFAAGIAGTGKTTVLKTLNEKVDNALYLGRDTAASEILTIDPNTGLPSEQFPEGLSTLEKYVEKYCKCLSF